MADENSSENKYFCKTCNYFTSRKSQYERHLLTAKHIKTEILTNPNNKLEKVVKKYVCKCGKHSFE